MPDKKDKKKTVEEQVESFVASFDENLKKERESNETITDAKLDAMKADFKKEMDDLIKSVRANNVNLPGVEDEKEEFSFAKAAMGVINNNWKDADFERKVMMETTEKAMDTNTGGQGGLLIPIELAMDKFITPAMANMVLKDLGMSVWDGLEADVELPEATSRPSLVWNTDGEAQSAQNISLANKYMRPKEGGMLVKLSNKLLKQAPAAEKIIKDLMMEGVQLGLDNIGINGLGNDKEPLGILNVSGTNTLAVGAARLTIDDVAGMAAAIEEDDFLKTGGGGFLTRPIVKSGLKREQVAMYSGDTAGMPILNPWMSDKMVEDTLGMKIRGTTNVAVASNATKGVLGDWKEFVMGIWGGMRLKSSDQAGTAFASNQTWLVIFMDVDTVCRRPLAFNIASGIKTNF